MQPAGFLAINPPVPVGRIAGAARAGGDARIFRWPVTIAAFVSAAGVDATEQLEALVDEIVLARAGLDVELEVFLADPELLSAAKYAIEGVNRHPMPADADALLDALNDLQPEIVHFFCHGVAAGQQQFLELATISDHLTDALAGSVQLPGWRLQAAPGAQSSWLVVLNCCESSAAANSGVNIGSMSFRMVKEGGIPACVGMSQPIDATDAELLAKRFYKRLLADLAPLTEATDPIDLDFADAVLEARQALYAKHANGVAHDPLARWSLPALYTTGAPLRVQSPMDVPSEQRLPLRTVQKFLATQPADTPPGVRADALNLIAAIPEGLQPDWLGRFDPTPPLSEAQEATLKTVATVLAGPATEAFRQTAVALLKDIPKALWPDAQGRLPLRFKDRTRLKVVSDYLCRLPADAPAILRDEALALLDDLPAAVRPDALGQLPEAV